MMHKWLRLKKNPECDWVRSPTQQLVLDYQILRKYNDDDLENFIKVITPQAQSLTRL